jgi:hypothetical protein
VSLRGTKSNRQGIGARITAEANGLTQTREMFPVCSFLSQAPNVVHFGLGDATAVERLTVRWPSGRVQVLTGLRPDRHIVVEEGRDGDAAVSTVIPGKAMQP